MWDLLRKQNEAPDALTVGKKLAQLLDSTANEEALQKFLEQHRFILARASGWGPGFLMVPKFKFGDEFVSDFVLGSWPQIWEFTLVELEPKDVTAFNRDGTPSRRLSQALKQLAEWNDWITHNRAYFTKRIERHVHAYLDEIAKSKSGSDGRPLEHLRRVDRC